MSDYDYVHYDYVLGIDLGTTNTLACYMEKGRPYLLKFPGGEMLPSVLYVDEQGTVYVGGKARNRGITDPQNMIRSSKTFIGKNKTWVCHGRTLTPTDVATEILKEVRRRFIEKKRCNADAKIGAVITVPAYFKLDPTEETRKAGEAAGFDVLQIITEPMAAAVAAVKEMDLEKKVFVVDLGGGTFDLSVLEANQGTHSYKAIDTNGEDRLGGDDFDKALFDYLVSLIKEDTGRDLSSPQSADVEYLQRRNSILTVAEQAKRDLSNAREAEIDIPNLFTDIGYDLSIRLSRDEFNTICQGLYDRILNRIHNFIEKNPKFRKEDLGEIILAGGSCYIPYIQDAIYGIFQKTPQSGMNLSTLVVIGACHVANWINSGLDMELKDILSHSLGVDSLNVETGKVEFSKILEKGTHYPCEETKPYTTIRDNQTEVELNIYEAGNDCEDSTDVSNHNLYGQIILQGIEKAPKGTPTINVTFKYDRSRCLTVTAVDAKTGAKKSLQINKGEYVISAQKSKENPLDIILVLDKSGSMSGKEMQEAKTACHALINEMIDFSVHRMGLISFNHQPQMHTDPTNDQSLLLKCVDSIVASGTTRMSEPLELAQRKLKGSAFEKVVILVTDGEPDYGDSEATVKRAKSLRDNDIRIIAIGTGNADEKFLKRLVGNRNDVYKLENMTKLRETFERVIQTVTSKF